jgi:AraC-like DNA-binding protein
MFDFSPPASGVPRADGQAAANPAFRPQWLPISGALSDFVTALMAVEVGPLQPMQLSIAPHDSLMLTVQLGRGSDCIEQKGPQGENTTLTGIRRGTGTFVPAGNCTTFFALLTPLGAMRLLDGQPLRDVPRIHARLAQILDRKITRQIETAVANLQTLEERLRVFAAWVEARAFAKRGFARAAQRTARAAMQICADPMAPVEAIASREHVTRRQLERDLRHWMGTSPRHLAQVARLQAVSRHAQRGWSLARIAAELGFADQAHMSRVVRQLTGVTPRSFVAADSTPMSAAFRAATAGGTVYL